MSLNPAQNEAVNTLSGPLLVLAGAGTGKTRVVTHRIAKLIQCGAAPNRILAVTFTNKAAREMQSRVSALLKRSKGRPEVSTFHSLCVRILRRHISNLGYPNQFAIYDRSDQESLVRQILKEIRVSDAALKPSEFLSIISRWKCESLSPNQSAGAAQTAKEHLASLGYSRYQKSLKTLGVVDFDDILLCTEELFSRFSDVKAAESERFDYLLIDEYQDTNMSQYRIVKALAEKHRNLCVVGDDDQAIYGWRGADVAHILGFKKDWPDAKTVRLQENYRSTQQIIDWANRLIAFNKQRHAKQLFCNVQGEPPKIIQCKDAESEAKTVINLIKNRMESASMQPRDFAILFRTNDQPRAFEMEMRAAKIPYVLIGGQSFFDKKEVRDILAYLKVANRPKDDISLLRILNTPPRGIGQTSIQKLTETAIGAKKSIWETIGEPLALQTDKTPVQKFQHLIENNAHSLNQKFTLETLQFFIDSIGYKKEIERQYTDTAEQSSRWESVGEIVNAAAAFIQENENPTLQGFLDNTSLGDADFGSSNEKELKRNAVTLMTLHAAKGLEFNDVFLVGLEEGTLPHKRSISEDEPEAVDEERRLCYVGLTRAKRRLTITLALNRLKWGKNRPTVPSRFLYEITGQTDSPNYFKAIAGIVDEKETE